MDMVTLNWHSAEAENHLWQDTAAPVASSGQHSPSCSRVEFLIGCLEIRPPLRSGCRMDKAVDQLVRYSIHNGTGVPGVSPQGRPVIVRYSTASSRKASITPSLKQIQQYLIREVSILSIAPYTALSCQHHIPPHDGPICFHWHQAQPHLKGPHQRNIDYFSAWLAS